MSELIGFFVVSILANLIADFIMLALLMWWHDELAHLERKLNDSTQDF